MQKAPVFAIKAHAPQKFSRLRRAVAAFGGKCFWHRPLRVDRAGALSRMAVPRRRPLQRLTVRRCGPVKRQQGVLELGAEEELGVVEERDAKGFSVDRENGLRARREQPLLDGVLRKRPLVKVASPGPA